MSYKIAKIILISIFFLYSCPIQAISQPMFLTPEYLGLIQQKISTCFIYPQEAILNGWEGIVTVKFVVAQDGRIKNIDIAESSGYPLLDAVAILAIKDASPYPFPAGYPEGRDLEIILPITYQAPDTAADFRAQPMQFYNALLANSLSTMELQDFSDRTPSAETKEVLYEKAFALADKGKPLSEPEQIVTAPTKETLFPPMSFLEWDEDSAIAPVDDRELQYFIALAMENNQPTKVAKEEIELARLKVAEAQRNFLPAVKLQQYFAEGVANFVGYDERESKIQVDQPLLYGGRLQDSLKQSQINLEITEKNYDRLKLDVIQKTETAYYNLVAAKMLLGRQNQLYQEGRDLLSRVEKLAAAGMVIPLEVTSAKAWLEQIKFQLDSTRQELFMAELTFNQVLGVKETPEVKSRLIEAKRLNLDLKSCLEVAMQHRPEIYLSELLVKFNQYNKKVETNKSSALTVDLTSSYGYYEGAFKTEEMDSSKNWYVGFKATLPWGGSTINTTASKEETQPRYGQTAPTESSSVTTEINLWDNIARVADKKKADIELHRSISDFDETLKTITFEVQDAFLNYEKAVLQLNTAKSDMTFRRNELNITKIRALTGETNLPSALSSLVNLSDSLTKYIQALANYRISLANLKKATGYGMKI